MEPAFADIDHAIQDCYDMKECLEKYDFHLRMAEPNQASLPAARKFKYFEAGTTKPANCIILENEDDKIIQRAWMALDKYIGACRNKGQNVMLFFLFAGHGMIANNEQVLLCNRFDDKAKFYAFFKVETMLRNLAQKYANVYIVTLFACCRQRFDPAEMCICFDEKKALEVKE